MLYRVIFVRRNLLRPAGIQLQPATFKLKVFYAEDLPRSKSSCLCTILMKSSSLVCQLLFILAVHLLYSTRIIIVVFQLVHWCRA